MSRYYITPTFDKRPERSYLPNYNIDETLGVNSLGFSLKCSVACITNDPVDLVG